MTNILKLRLTPTWMVDDCVLWPSERGGGIVGPRNWEYRLTPELENFVKPGLTVHTKPKPGNGSISCLTRRAPSKHHAGTSNH
jgi:hypothetical protein